MGATALSRAGRSTLLRVVTCGSAGAGKSALIRRLLEDSQLLLGEAPSVSAAESELENASAAAGPHAEGNREITIAAPRRKLIISDIPGSKDDARKLSAGASNADAGLILIDAGKGLLPQTRRHSYILALLGVRDVVLAVNKMDTIGWDGARFERLRDEYLDFARGIGLSNASCVPTCALHGDNVARPSDAAPWYGGSTLLEYLESAKGSPSAAAKSFRMPVERFDRRSQLSECKGTIASGTLRPGDRIVALPSGRAAAVARIATSHGDVEEALAGQAVTLTLAEEIDLGAGDMLAAEDARPAVAEQFSAHVVWTGEHPLLPGRSYLLRIGAALVDGQVTALKYKLSMETFEHLAARHLDRNEIAFCNLAVERPIAFDTGAENRETATFTLMEPVTHTIAGYGVIAFPLRRAANIYWQPLKIDKNARARLKSQEPCVLWLTGLPSAGKSTIADLIEQALHRVGHHTIVLDGDNVRHGLNRDLGFTDEDRVENIRRVAEVAKLMVEAGLIVIVSFISPFRSERRMARSLFKEGEFIEVFVDTPLEICEARDRKGLYRLARAGKLPNFTGIGSPYEPPERAELVLTGGAKQPQVLADELLALLNARGII